MEIWKDVPGYEGMYQASNLGNIRSLDRVIIRKNGHKMCSKGKNLSKNKTLNGYFSVVLTYKNNKKNNIYS